MAKKVITGRAIENCSFESYKKLTWPDFEIDHIKPHSKGGKTDLANAALICKKDNAAKGNR